MVASLVVSRLLLGLDSQSKFSRSIIFLLYIDGTFVHVKDRETKKKDIS